MRKKLLLVGGRLAKATVFSFSDYILMILTGLTEKLTCNVFDFLLGSNSAKC